jgi:hypothetical protein
MKVSFPDNQGIFLEGKTPVRPVRKCCSKKGTTNARSFNTPTRRKIYNQPDFFQGGLAQCHARIAQTHVKLLGRILLHHKMP